MNFKLPLLTSCVLLAYSMGSTAGQLEIKPSISTSLIRSQNDSERFGEGDASIISVKPSIRTNYKSKIMAGNFSVSHNEIRSDISDESQSDSFTNYRYSGDISLIERILSLNLGGGQSYRSVLASQYFVNDPYLGADGLSKTQTNSAGFLFTLPSRKYFRFNVNGGLSNVKSDRSDLSSDTGADIEIDNKNQFLVARLYQGSEFSNLSWNFTSNYQNTDRTIGDNLTSRVINGQISFGLFGDIRAVVTGNSEENELANSDELSARDLNYDSYGVGISWFASANRTLTITYNQSERSNQEDETFVGIDLNWNFTRRTSIQANYGKRFFGDSGSFSFSHNTRHLRTRINYSENLTTSSRLLTRLEDQGAFVCPAGLFTASDCFVPPSPSYSLQPGEQFSNLFAAVPELSEQVILRKTLNASVGLKGRKLTSTLSVSHSNTEYLENPRVQKQNTASLSNSFKINNSTSLNLSVNYAVTEEETTGRETDTISSTLGMSRKLGRNMSTNLSFRYLDRGSSNDDPDAMNASNLDIKDKRLTLEFVYDF
ncbi:TIGR03016 family PEP-CTERM system-associated outer membrane protein [uncultured Paraglaciecola sp.]|uniref:TIGR03016 family PEP-CTERM system-associated outer membrane protein n=1 Tax=uncultured Paraglaciecola sp. TaxID=1765024 RepID=UPI002637E178|nr:TIGR03016 family PEP-CTERM system-associated outer membrane protein [uncultured Paraglaciecola sp.]